MVHLESPPVFKGLCPLLLGSLMSHRRLTAPRCGRANGLRPLHLKVRLCGSSLTCLRLPGCFPWISIARRPSLSTDPASSSVSYISISLK